MSDSTQLSFTQVPTGVTERDFEPVRDLIDEIKRHEKHESLAKAVVTWQNAFTVFKKLERRLNLPESDRELVVYQAIVNDLRRVGYWLLETISAEDANLAAFGVSSSALRACITELEIDDEVGALREYKPALEKLEAHFS